MRRRAVCRSRPRLFAVLPQGCNARPWSLFRPPHGRNALQLSAARLNGHLRVPRRSTAHGTTPFTGREAGTAIARATSQARHSDGVRADDSARSNKEKQTDSRFASPHGRRTIRRTATLGSTRWPITTCTPALLKKNGYEGAALGRYESPRTGLVAPAVEGTRTSRRLIWGSRGRAFTSGDGRYVSALIGQNGARMWHQLFTVRHAGVARCIDCRGGPATSTAGTSYALQMAPGGRRSGR